MCSRQRRADYRQLERERKGQQKGRWRPAERGINGGGPTGGVFTDNLAASALRSRSERLVDRPLERARKLTMLRKKERGSACIKRKRLYKTESILNLRDAIRLPPRARAIRRPAVRALDRREALR